MQARANVEKSLLVKLEMLTDRWILHNLNETIGKVTAKTLISLNLVWLVTSSTTSSGMSLRTGMLS